MPLFRKSAMTALAAALGASEVAAQKGDEKKGKSGGKKEQKAATANSDEPLELPIPKGKPQKGLKVPIYGGNGKLDMTFTIGIATLVDKENVKLEELRVETYNEDGTPELDINLPDAMFNKQTKIITAKAKVVIKREDFEVTGNTVAFNVQTRQGTLGGGVKMVINNLGEFAEPQSDKPSVEFEPKPAAPPVKIEPK
jgi:hypothetical protein